MARLSEFQRRYFQRIAGSNTILTINASNDEIRKILIQSGVTNEAVRVVYFDTTQMSDTLNLELTTPKAKTTKKLTFKD